MNIKELRNYAEWYYTKFFPSRKVLRERLIARGASREDIESIFLSMADLIVEEKVVESIVHTYVGQGKTPSYIRQKLRLKGFESSMVEKFLEGEGELLTNPETYRKQIEKRIQIGRGKGLSRKALQYELNSTYSSAGGLIKELLASYDDTEVLAGIITQIAKKYSREELLKKLLQKGFTITDIKKILR